MRKIAVYSLLAFLSGILCCNRGDARLAGRNRFMSQGTGELASEIFAESETKFFLEVSDGKVEFVKDEPGKVTAYVLTQRGRTMQAKRIVK